MIPSIGNRNEPQTLGVEEEVQKGLMLTIQHSESQKGEAALALDEGNKVGGLAHMRFFLVLCRKKGTNLGFVVGKSMGWSV